MKQIQGGVTAAKGFEAAGVEAAIKYQNRKDMALIVSKAPCTVAGTFTSNVVKAAPVLWDKQIVEHSAFAQAVVVNSGIANACTANRDWTAVKQKQNVPENCWACPPMPYWLHPPVSSVCRFP